MYTKHLKAGRIRPESTVIQPTERFGDPKHCNLLLLVGLDGSPGGLRRFLVSESHVSNLGPRWQQLLSSCQSVPKTRYPFRTTIKTINLRDEDTNAIRMIMHLAHVQFNKLPEKLDFKEIVRLAEVAERYAVQHMLAHHIDGWIAPYRDRLLDPGYEEWLYIAYQFGFETEYLKLAKHLALHCRVDVSGTRLLSPVNHELLDKQRFPVLALEQIDIGRHQLLSSMLKGAYDLWVSLSDGLPCKVNETNTDVDHTNMRKRCAAINFRGLTLFLRELELFPMLKSTEAVRSSPFELSRMLSHARRLVPFKSVFAVRRRGSASTVSERHRQCRVGHQLATKMAEVLDNRPWPVRHQDVGTIRRNAAALSKYPDTLYDETKFLQWDGVRRLMGEGRVVTVSDPNPNVLNVR